MGIIYGVQAFNHGEYPRALEHFDEASRARPGDGEVLYWLARTHLELGELKEAVALFEKSLATRALGSEREEEVRARLNEVRQQPEAPSSPPAAVVQEGTRLVLPDWNGFPRIKTRFSANVGSDSNPGLLPDEVNVDPRFRIGDSQVVSDVEVLAELYPLSGRANRTLELSLEGRRSFHGDDPELDMGQVRGLFQFAWGRYPLGYLSGPLGTIRAPSGTSGYSFLVQLGLVYTELDGTRLYEASQGAMSVVRAWDRSALQLDVAFQDFDFDPGLSSFNGSDARLRISQTFFFRKRRTEEPRLGYPRLQYLRLGLGTGRQDGARDFENTFLDGSFESSFRLSRRQYLYLAAALRRTDFDRSNREETTWRASAAFVRTLRPALHLTARVTYGERDSNGPDPFRNYDQVKTSIGLAWYFR